MREQVQWFANEMERVLQDNDWKGGWDNAPIAQLFDKLKYEEMQELADEIESAIYEKIDTRSLTIGNDNDDTLGKFWELVDKEIYGVLDLDKVIKESVDVANIAMMIADRARKAKERRNAV